MNLDDGSDNLDKKFEDVFSSAS
jgi:hypothetical protein